MRHVANLKTCSPKLGPVQDPKRHVVWGTSSVSDNCLTICVRIWPKIWKWSATSVGKMIGENMLTWLTWIRPNQGFQKQPGLVLIMTFLCPKHFRNKIRSVFDYFTISFLPINYNLSHQLWPRISRKSSRSLSHFHVSLSPIIITRFSHFLPLQNISKFWLSFTPVWLIADICLIARV